MDEATISDRLAEYNPAFLRQEPNAAGIIEAVFNIKKAGHRVTDGEHRLICEQAMKRIGQHDITAVRSLQKLAGSEYDETVKSRSSTHRPEQPMAVKYASTARRLGRNSEGVTASESRGRYYLDAAIKLGFGRS